MADDRDSVLRFGYNTSMIEKLRQNDFSLVLSGGGALGISHLGVLHDLEKASLHPAEIIGTSMGGIVGACTAIGMKEADIYSHIKSFSKIYNWMKFSLSGNAMIDNDRIALIFEELFGKRKMGETEIPLKLIATNLFNGHKRVFSAADDVTIKDAILCTMAIPGIFEEHVVGGETYGDGFLCENLGVKEAEYDLVLAIDVLGENSFEKEMPDNFFKTANVMEMFEKSVRLLIYNQSRSHIACSDREILLIEPETKGYKTFSFHKYKEIRERGLGLLK